MLFGEKNSCFGFLPLEMVTEVMNYLRHLDKKSCRLGCHRWNYILSNFCNTFSFRPTLKNTTLKYILMTNKELNCVTVRGLNKRLPRMSNSSKNEFPHMRNVIIERWNSETAIVNLMKYGLKYTITLSLRNTCLKSVRRYIMSRTLRECKWDHLTKLWLEVQLKKDDRHFQATSTFIKFVNIPNLYHFRFFFDDTEHVQGQGIQIRRLFLFLYAFLARHGRVLRDLFYWINCSRRRIGRELPRISESAGSSIVKIQNCCIWLIGSVSGFEYLVSPNLIGSELKYIKIDTECADDMNLNTSFRHLFESSSKTLENINISGDDLNIYWLQNCPSLKSLTLCVDNLTLPMGGLIFHPDVKALNLRIKILRPNIFDTTQELLIHASKKLEQMELLLHKETYIVDWNWLNLFVSLKYLKLALIEGLINIATNFHISFPNLIKFEGQLLYKENDDNKENVSNWIKQSMPNLEVLKLAGSDISLLSFKILFRMAKLKKIYFEHTQLLDSIILIFQKTRGLYFTGINEFPYNYLIKINRNTFTMPITWTETNGAVS